jgi:hypothetical protein
MTRIIPLAPVDFAAKWGFSEEEAVSGAGCLLLQEVQVRSLTDLIMLVYSMEGSVGGLGRELKVWVKGAVMSHNLPDPLAIKTFLIHDLEGVAGFAETVKNFLTVPGRELDVLVLEKK